MKVVWQTVRRAAGLTLVAVGMIGTLVPIIPGMPLLIVGVALLGSNHPRVRPLVARLRLWRRKWKRSSPP